MPASPARVAAFDILLRLERRGGHASELLHSALLKKLSPQDRNLTTELVMGVLRWRSRLDDGVALASSQPLQKLDPEVLTALRMGAYQLGWLRVPERAAVHESVELVKQAGKRFAAPFANAVLRQVARQAPGFAAPLPPAEVAELARAYAHPPWLVGRWAERYGRNAAEKTCAYDQQAPNLHLRLTDPAAEGELLSQGVTLEPGKLLTSARRAAGDVTRSRAFAEGGVVVQDEASQLVALLLGRGERLLDCCAAPGGKTAILAERNPHAQVLAVDLHPRRASLMKSRLGAGNVGIVAADAAALPLEARFDRILADVPCSGTGTLARHPEIKWRLRPEDPGEMQQRQVAILRSAAARLAAGGKLIYSTCSLEREENEDVVEQAAAGDLRVGDCRLELERLRRESDLAWSDLDGLLSGPFLRTLPGVHFCDGFFAAVLEKG